MLKNICFFKTEKNRDLYLLNKATPAIKVFFFFAEKPLGGKQRQLRTVHDIYTLHISYLQFPIGHLYMNVPSLICYLSKIILPQKMPSYVENGHVDTVGEKVRVG